MKMLVVDDAVQICAGIRDGIDWTKHGLGEVLTADNGSDGLRLFLSAQPEIVVADIRMAGLDGLELSREILTHCPETRIILLSAYSEFEYARRALALGVFAYELKPLKIARLVERVEEAQRAWHALRARDSAAQQYDRICRERTLTRLLHEPAPPDGSAADFFAQQYGLALDARYLCAVFVQQSSPLRPESLTKLVLQYDGAYLMQEGTRHIALFAGTNSLLYMERLVSELQRLVRYELPVGVTCGVSAHGLLDNLSTLYTQATQAQQLCFYTGPNTLNRYHKDVALVTRELPPCEEDLLAAARGAQDGWSAIQTRLRQCFDALSGEKERCTPACVHAFTLDLLRSLRRTTSAWLDDEDADVADAVGQLMNASPLPYLEDYRRLAEDTYHRVYQRYFGGEGDRLGHFALHCKAFIGQNYAQDLCVQELADRFGITPNYFSHLFKKTMGISFKRYLNAVRIEQANALLEQGTLPTLEIAKRVGFEDYKYFYQVYRKYMNRAPTRGSAPSPGGDT